MRSFTRASAKSMQEYQTECSIIKFVKIQSQSFTFKAPVWGEWEMGLFPRDRLVLKPYSLKFLLTGVVERDLPGPIIYIKQRASQGLRG